MLYAISLLVFICICVTVILVMPRFTNKNITNLIFVLIISISYYALVIYVLYDVGLNDWNFLNTLPVANVSPFMFFVVPFIYIMPSKIKKYLYLLVSLLGVGMFLSPTINCIYLTITSFRFHPHFLLDYTAHFALFLWGVYLIRSRQIELNIKDCLISGSIMVGVAICMMIINVIFDTSFFGLSLNGKHNIYNEVIVSNSFLSAFLYLCGLIVVLLSGYLLHRVLNKIHEWRLRRKFS